MAASLHFVIYCHTLRYAYAGTYDAITPLRFAALMTLPCANGIAQHVLRHAAPYATTYYYATVILRALRHVIFIAIDDRYWRGIPATSDI